MDSRQYVTINTHKGLLRYTRLPFGVSADDGSHPSRPATCEHLPGRHPGNRRVGGNTSAKSVSRVGEAKGSWCPSQARKLLIHDVRGGVSRASYLCQRTAATPQQGSSDPRGPYTYGGVPVAFVSRTVGLLQTFPT